VIISPEAHAEIRLLGVAAMPANATDLSGLTGSLSDGTPHNQLGGFSGIEYSGQGQRYYVLPDRGPVDGAVPFACRLHEFEIAVQPDSESTVRAKLTRTAMFTSDGRPLIGSAAAFDAHDPKRSLRFDPEAVRRWGLNQLLVSEEYGPSLSLFNLSGERVRQFDVPSRFQLSTPAATPADELTQNSSGRQPNAGFEGVAVSPDGDTLFAIVQRPLIQDSQPNQTGRRSGRNCRLWEWNHRTSESHEWIYPLDNDGNGVNELLAIGPRELLVLERDSLEGEQARHKRLYRVAMTGASDSHDISALPIGECPPSIRPLKKHLFLDFLDPRWNIAGSHCPEKFEGLTFGPRLADGRHLLLVAVDNDFRRDRPSLIYAFALDPHDLQQPLK
jgi:hypothetical protein